MGEEKEPAFQNGDRAAIVKGRNNVGIRGQVFWIGENKYGPGVRYGLRGDDGESYWVDETNIGPEEGAPPAPDAAEPGEPLARGSRVSITKGRSAGVVGEVFWVGDSKYGAGMRYGVKDEDGETHWADGREVELLAAPEAGGGEARGGGAEPSGDAPPDDHVPFPDGEDDFAAPGGGFEDDIPFPGDDMPF